jgi:hypothetical protein
MRVFELGFGLGPEDNLAFFYSMREYREAAVFF